MSIELYYGEVVFPPGQPYDGGFGPSINILVKMDKPNAPKVNDKGETRIYKKVDDPDAGYMYTLGKGDRVTLAWNEAGPKSHYSFVYDSASDNAPPPYSKPEDSTSSGYVNKRLAPSVQAHAQTREITVDRQPPGNMDAWDYIGDYELEMYDRYLNKVISKYPDHPDPHQLTGRIHGWAHGWWRPGAVLGGAESNVEDEREAFLQLVHDNGGDARAWLASAGIMLEAEEKDILDVITKLGIQSGEWLKDDDGKWNLVQVVREYWNLANGGMDHGDIAERLNKRFGVKLPVEKDESPF